MQHRRFWSRGPRGHPVPLTRKEILHGTCSRWCVHSRGSPRLPWSPRWSPGAGHSSSVARPGPLRRKQHDAAQAEPEGAEAAVAHYHGPGSTGNSGHVTLLCAAILRLVMERPVVARARAARLPWPASLGPGLVPGQPGVSRLLPASPALLPAAALDRRDQPCSPRASSMYAHSCGVPLLSMLRSRWRPGCRIALLGQVASPQRCCSVLAAAPHDFQELIRLTSS
jgi:hypothetical protein